MTRQSWGWTLIVAAILLVVAGWLVTSFLGEPSAVGRVRTAMVGIGVALIAIGLAGGVAGVWMLVTRRT